MLSEASSVTYYIVAGKTVCKTAWYQVLKFSPKRVSKAMKVVKEGQISLLYYGMKVVYIFGLDQTDWTGLKV